MMFSKRVLSLASGCLLLLGCGGGEGGGGIGLGELEGSYDITSVVASESALWETETPLCSVEVHGSRVSSECSKSDGVASEDLSIDIVVQETLISGDLVYVYERGADESCYQSITETTTVSLSASKDSGVMVQGVFAPIAGSWTGDLTIEVAYDFELLPAAPSWCDQGVELFAVNFAAEIAGSTAQVNWSGDGEMGTLEVIGSENAISVNGEAVSK